MLNIQSFFWRYFAFTVLLAGGLAWSFLLLERGINPEARDWFDAWRWLLGHVPFVGQLSLKPVTPEGTFLSLVVRIAGFFVLAGWVSWLGMRLFRSRLKK